MPRFDGSLARKLDFGEMTTPTHGPSRSGLRLALPSGVLRGPDKYKQLDRRRRRAQIQARHALGLMDLFGTK